MDNYRKITIVGKGSFGTVYRAACLKTGDDVAVKRFIVNNEGDLSLRNVKEISRLRNIDHPNIVGIREIIFGKRRIFIVSQLHTMNLKRYFRIAKYTSSNPRLNMWLHQLLSGVLHFHNRGIVHGSIKPSNIFISEDGTLKLADFGLARYKSAVFVEAKNYSQIIESLWYSAPELLLSAPEQFNIPVDIWSIACVFAEMANGFPLFQGVSQTDQLLHIMFKLGTPNESVYPGVSKLPRWNPDFYAYPFPRKRDLLRMLPGLHVKGITVVASMLAYDPQQRITAEGALMEYFL